MKIKHLQELGVVVLPAEKAEIFDTRPDFDIEETVLVQRGKMCAEIGQYVRRKDYEALLSLVKEVDVDLGKLLDRKKIVEIITNALSHYQHSKIHDDGGCSLHLVDLLTPEETTSIREGQDEIEYITDDIADALLQADLVKEV